MREKMKRSKGILDQRLARIAAAPKPAALGIARRRKDARRSERQTTFKPATIAYGRDNVAHCIVNNLSADGARVAIDRGGDTFPVRVRLKLDAGAVARNADIVWRKNNEYGLSFADAPPPRAIR